MSLFEDKPQKTHISKVSPNLSHSPLNTEQKEKEYQHHIWTTLINGIGVDPNSYWGKVRESVFSRDHNCCVECGTVENLTVHHKLPLSLGGDNSLENLTLLCDSCHSEKHNLPKSFIAESTFDSDSNYGQQYRLTKKIAVLSSAMKTNSTVPIIYKDWHNVRSERLIKPKKIFKERNKIYVYAYCELDNDNRLFRESRITLGQPYLKNRYINKPVVARDLDPEVLARFKKHIE